MVSLHTYMYVKALLWSANTCGIWSHAQRGLAALRVCLRSSHGCAAIAHCGVEEPEEQGQLHEHAEDALPGLQELRSSYDDDKQAAYAAQVLPFAFGVS